VLILRMLLLLYVDDVVSEQWTEGDWV